MTASVPMSSPSSGSTNSVPVTSICASSTVRTGALVKDAAKYPVKKTAINDPTASTELTSGNIRTRANGPRRTRRSWRTLASPHVASARATGSPSASPTGVTAESTVTWTAPTQSNDER